VPITEKEFAEYTLVPGSRPRIQILVSDETPVAFSCGTFQKRIVLPNDGSPGESLVLAHELIHHMNGDVWRAGVGQFVASLFFFHPLVHVFHRETRLLVELACDQQVLSGTGVRRAEYATLLLRYVDHKGLRSTPALAMSDTRSHLYRRITAMKDPIRAALGRRAVYVIAAFILGAGVFASACSESALVAPDESDFDEMDVRSRTMELPTSDADVFVIVDFPPELIGGLAGLQESLQYPSIAQRAGVQGRVFLQFVVQPDGSTSDVIVTRGIGAGCDEEAIRVVREARFVPGVQDGKRIPVKMSIPITFKLAEEEPTKTAIEVGEETG
jgi:TonB family protein